MTLIINPGSNVGDSRDGWTNTEAGARKEAESWLTGMHFEGMTDVELLPGCRESDGRWVFSFRHSVTGKTVELETHGIDDIDAYCKRYVFSPKVYWGGSSLGQPEIEHFAATGFAVRKTFVPVALKGTQS